MKELDKKIFDALARLELAKEYGDINIINKIKEEIKQLKELKEDKQCKR